MDILEIILLIGGILCIIASFLIGEKENNSETENILKNLELSEQDKEYIRKQIETVIDEQLRDISERTEAQLDKISNTKMLEMNDYAETIMKEINRNHNETVFLYDMLNEKSKELKTTVKDVNIAKREVVQMKQSVAKEEVVKADAVATMDKANVKTDGKIESQNQTEQVTDNRGSRDLAKERLIALVKKSNEKIKEIPKESAKPEQPEQPIQPEQSEQAEEPKKTRKTKTAASKTGTTTASAKAKKTSSKKVSEEDIKEKIIKIKSDSNASKNDIIIAIHKLGLSNKDIAKELNIGVGEVKLVIDLYSSTK